MRLECVRRTCWRLRDCDEGTPDTHVALPAGRPERGKQKDHRQTQRDSEAKLRVQAEGRWPWTATFPFQTRDSTSVMEPQSPPLSPEPVGSGPRQPAWAPLSLGLTALPALPGGAFGCKRAGSPLQTSLSEMDCPLGWTPGARPWGHSSEKRLRSQGPSPQ